MVRVTIKKVKKNMYGDKTNYSIRKDGKHIVFRDTKAQALKEQAKIKRMAK